VTRESFLAWLNGITPTKPFTLGDAAELHAMIRTALGANVFVDVYTTKGDKVHVRVDAPNLGLIERSIDVV